MTVVERWPLWGGSGVKCQICSREYDMLIVAKFMLPVSHNDNPVKYNI